jgi:hypothetical protein
MMAVGDKIWKVSGRLVGARVKAMTPQEVHSSDVAGHFNLDQSHRYLPT